MSEDIGSWCYIDEGIDEFEWGRTVIPLNDGSGGPVQADRILARGERSETDCMRRAERVRTSEQTRTSSHGASAALMTDPGGSDARHQVARGDATTQDGRWAHCEC